MAYYYYWTADWDGKKHSQDVYLLAPVAGASDHATDTEKGLLLNGNLALSIGGEPKHLPDGSKCEWNINQTSIYVSSAVKAPSLMAAVNFDGNGTVYLSSQTGGSGSDRYDDQYIKISAHNNTTNMRSWTKESNWSEWSQDLEEIQYPSYPNELYPESSAIGDSVAVYATKTLTVGSTFNGYFESAARHLSHGGYYSNAEGKKVLRNSTDSTSTISAGFRGESVVFEGSFFGSMDISSRADLATFASRTMTNNTIGAYSVYSPSGLSMKTGLWGGQIKASVHCNTLNAENAYAVDDKGWVKAEGNGSLTGNLVQSGAVKASSIYINVVDSSENEERVSYPLQIVNYDVLPEDETVTIDDTTFEFETTKGLAQDAMWDDEDNGSGYLRWVCTEPEDEVSYYSVSWEDTKGALHTETIRPDQIARTGNVCVLYLKNSENLHESLDEISASKRTTVLDSLKVQAYGTFGTTACTGKTYTEPFEDSQLVWYRKEKVELPDSAEGVCGVLITYDTISKDGTATPGTAFVSYRDQDLEDGFIHWDSTNHRYYCELGSPQKTYVVKNIVEIGTDLDGSSSSTLDGLKYYNMTGVADSGTGSYTLEWISNSNQLSGTPITLNYTLNEENKQLTIDENIAYQIETVQPLDGGATQDYYKYSVTVTDTENLQYNVPMDQNVVIYAEAQSNTLAVGGYFKQSQPTNTMTDNIIQAIGLDADSDLTLNLFTAPSIIQVQTLANTMTAQYTSQNDTVYNNQINAIGMKGNTVNLKDFYGTIRVTNSNNYMDVDAIAEHVNYMTTAGVKAATLNGSSNLYGTLNITAEGNSNVVWVAGNNTLRADLPTPTRVFESNQITAGYYVTGNMLVTGSLNTEIDITVDGAEQLSAGYYVQGILRSSGYNGTIHVDGGTSSYIFGTKFGIYAKTLHSNDCDLFTVGGDITVSGSAYRNVGIAVDSKADLLLTGTINVSGADPSGVDSNYAVMTDYQNTIATGFNNDRLELAAGANVIGNIDLGGGTNVFTVNSEATFNGYVEHGVGTTNIVYRLAGIKDEVVSTITSKADASLTTGNTFTLNCNDVQEGTYQLMEYSGDAKAEADKFWKNAVVTVEQQGVHTDLYMLDNKATGSLKVGGQTLALSVNYNDGTVSVTVTKTGKSSVCDIYAVGLDSSGDAVLYQTKETTETALLTAYNELLGGKAKDKLVTTVTDPYTSVVSSSVELNWMQQTASGLYEVTYQIYEKDGTLVTENVVRLDPAKILKAQNLSDTKYDLYSYTVKCVPEDGYVTWSVRNYGGDGSTTSQSTCSDCRLGTTSTSSVDSDLRKMNLNDLGSLLAVNPDDSTKGIGSAVVKFTWDAPMDSYAVDYYTLEFFNSPEPLSDDGKSIFSVYENGKSYAMKKDGKWYKVGQPDAGTQWWIRGDADGDVFIGTGDTSDSVSVVCNFSEKQTTATELLASSQNNQGYVYWRVKATALEKNSSGKAIEGEFQDGIAFQISENDVTGPTFTDDVNLEAVAGYKTDPVTDQVSAYTLNNINWYVIQNSEKKSVKAIDGTGESGTYSYSLEYYDSETSSYKTLYTWEESKIYNDEGKLTELSDVVLPYSGKYTLRVTSRDMAGNSGDSTLTYVVYAQDTLAPETQTVTSTREASYKSGYFIGYTYAFTWKATEDAKKDAQNLKTGLYDYTITWKYTDKENESGYLSSYTVEGYDSEAEKWVTLKTVDSPDYFGQVQLTGDDLNYSSYRVTSPDTLMYQTSPAAQTGNKYTFTVTASDRAGNTTTLTDGTLKIDDEPDLVAPEGIFNLKQATVTVTSREGEETKTDSNSNEETATETESETGKALSADVTFSWTDTFKDDTGSGVRYLLQFSNQEYFTGSKTYTYIVVDQADSVDQTEQLYTTLLASGQYENLRIVSVADLSAKTVTFSNSYMTVNSGLFSGMSKVYWRMKAMDTAGNLTEDWSASKTFSFTDSALDNSVIKDTAKPAQPSDLKIAKDTYDSKTHRYTGDVSVSYTFANTGFGVSYSTLTLTNKKTKKSKTITVDHTLQSGTETGTAQTITCNISTELNKLEDGTYTISVTNYGAGGSVAGANKVDFVQDCTAPTAAKTISVTNLPVADGVSVTYVTWGASTDSGSGLDYYLLRWKKNGTDDWNEQKLSASTTMYNLDLTVGTKYDFSVIAVDKKGNYSDETTLEEVGIIYSDIDSDGPYNYTSNGAFSGELIGQSDESDMIKVETSETGIMEITISNLCKLLGSGTSLVVSILNSNQQEMKKWTVSADKESSSVTGKKLRYYCNGNIGDCAYIKIISSSTKNILQYALNYDYTHVDEYEADNTAYGTDHTITVTSTSSGTADIENEDGWIKNINVSCGNADDYARLSLEKDGKYTFTLTKQDSTATDSLSTAKFFIYSTTAGKTSLVKVKEVSLASGSLSVTLSDLLLDAGEYFIRVNAPKASSVANLALTLSVSASLYTAKGLDNVDDVFGNLPDSSTYPNQYRFDTNPKTESETESETKTETKWNAANSAVTLSDSMLVINAFKNSSRKVSAAYTLSFKENGNFIRGGYDEKENLEYDWVGYGDKTDYTVFNAEVGGNYTFSLLKAADLENFTKTTGSLTLTVYTLKDGATSLSKVKSITLKDQSKEKLYFDGTTTTESNAVYTLSQLSLNLSKGTYYFSVTSDNAAKGDSISYALVANGVQCGESNYTTIDTAKDVPVITAKGTAELQETYQYTGLDCDTVWYNLEVQGTGNHSITLTKESYTKDTSQIAVTVYKSSGNGTKLSSVKSITIDATKNAGTLSVSGLAAGNYLVQVKAKNASSGKSASFTLKDEVSVFQEQKEAVVTDDWFAGAKDLGTFDSETEELSLDDTVISADQKVRYVKFNTGNWAGEFNLSSDETITAYTLKAGATSLTKLTGTKLFLDANTTYYVAITNNGGTAVDLKVTRGDAARIVSNDNNWAELADEYQEILNSTEKPVNWSDAVGYGDLLSSRKLTLTNDGKYNFSLDLDSEDQEGACPKVTMKLYKWNSNGNGLTQVKSLSADKDLTGVLLSAGDYYVVVSGSNVKGYTGYNMEVTADFLAPAKDDNNTPSSADQIAVNNGAFEAIDDKWVGYQDEYDYYQLNLDDFSTGTYSFSFTGNDAAKYTIYAVRSTDSTLVKVYEYTAKKAMTEPVTITGMKLDADTTYLLEVRSTNAAKGGNCYFSFEKTDFNATYYVSETPKKNLSTGNTTAEFVITEATKGKYTFNLEAGQTIQKYDPKTGKYSNVKLDSKKAASLTAGKYMICNIDGSVYTEYTFDTAAKKVTADTVSDASSISVEDHQISGETISTEYCYLTMDSVSTGDYTFTINSEYGGTVNLYVRDANAPDCGMSQLAAYELTKNGSCNSGLLLLNSNSEYLLEFVSDDSDVEYSLQQNSVHELQELETEVLDTDEVFFDVEEDALYTIELEKGDQTLNYYNAATGKEEVVAGFSSEVEKQVLYLEKGEYFVRTSGAESYNFTLDTEDKKLVATQITTNI